ncbi:uncharacterized protein LOC142322673 [Lycorma delicatula]|uniref:uncharacterized protein LOC142322673 n=1 Tax=Lycorma delicatula TaxID=130591 RepID=UPI003F512FA2
MSNNCKHLTKVYFINKNETATDAKSEVYYDKENYHLLEKFLMDSCMINNLENTNMDCHPTQNISDEEMDCDMNQNISDEKMDCHLNQNISDSNFEEMDCHQNQRDEEMDCHLNQNISDEEMDCDLKQNTSDEKEKNSINEDSRGKLNSKKHKRTKGEQSETPNYIQKIVEENSSSKCSPTSKVNPNCTGDQNIIQKTLLDELFDSMQGETCNLEKEGQQPKNSVPSTKGIEKTLKENGYLPDCLEETEDKCLEKYFPKLCAISCKSETSKNYEIPCKVFRCVVCKYTWFQLFDLCRIKRHEFKVSNGKKCYFRCTNCSRPIIYPKVTISFKCSKCGKKEWERIALISIL